MQNAENQSTPDVSDKTGPLPIFCSSRTRLGEKRVKISTRDPFGVSGVAHFDVHYLGGRTGAARWQAASTDLLFREICR